MVIDSEITSYATILMSGTQKQCRRTIKRIVIAVFILIVSFESGNAASSYEFVVDTKDNCVLLDSSPAVPIFNLPADTYAVSVSGSIESSPGISIEAVLLRYHNILPGPTNKNDRVDIPGIAAFPIGTSAGYSAYAMLCDIGPTADNSGACTVYVGETEVVLDATSDCISVNDIPAVTANIPGGTYVADATGWGPSQFQQLVVTYLAPDGPKTTVIEYGTWHVLQIEESTDANLFAYFLDWSDIGDNFGEGTLTISTCFDRFADLNCDGVSDAVDLNALIDHLFFNGTIPPCTVDPLGP